MIKRISMIVCLALVLSLGSVVEGASVDEKLIMNGGLPWVISVDWGCDGSPEGGEIIFKMDGTIVSGSGTKTGKWYMVRSLTENNLEIMFKYDNEQSIYAGKLTSHELWKWEGILVRTSDGKKGCWRIRHK